MKEKLRNAWKTAVKNGKYVFPVIVCLAVAITVVVALRAKGVRNEELEKIGETIQSPTPPTESSSDPASDEVALKKNEDPQIEEVILKYYNALADGDEAALNAICDKIDDIYMLWFLETSKYIEHYSFIEIYVKPGYAEGETIAYVYFKAKLTGKDAEYPSLAHHYICTAEDGSLYVKFSTLSTEQEEYKMKVSKQADVLELVNRVKVEFDELMEEQPDLLAYMGDVSGEVKSMVGIEISSQKGDPGQDDPTEPSGDGNGESGEGQEGNPDQRTEADVEEITYAVASTTVNVRKSDSQKAEKLGRLTGGTKVQVLEELVNGWTKILFEKQEGYVMSKYLKVQESALKYTPIGKVKALDNINVRADASTDSTKIGTLVKGDEADLLEVEGEWCKISFKNQIAYVKAEYVERQ